MDGASRDNDATGPRGEAPGPPTSTDGAKREPSPPGGERQPAIGNAMEWNIAKSRRQCACGRQLGENEEYFAALTEEGEAFVRHDYCAACWEQARAAGGFFSFWRTAVPPKEQKRRLFADNGVLLDFFVRLEHEEAEQKRQFFYLLALILLRKRLVKFHDVERDGDHEVLCLRCPSEDRVFRVHDPQLNDEQIEALKEQLSQILDFQV